MHRNYQPISQYLKPNKVLVIYGSRQIGKTTLLEMFLEKTDLKYKLDSGDNIQVQHILSSQNFNAIKEYAAGYELIVIDEAQNIKHIGQALKIMVDQIPNIKIIATGSSSFELANQIGEPLTGRKRTLLLYPMSQIELSEWHNAYELKTNLEEWIIFGGYPEVVLSKTRPEKIQLLNEIVQSYLLKDILALEKVKSSKILLDLLRLLAYQIGSEVSMSEIASQLGIDQKTVARYLDLFEKTFIIYNLRGFSRNLRSEITKKSKYYFYDIGVRNAIISNFNALSDRNDTGQLWENFLVVERLKKQAYHNIYANNYFWRTWEQKEIDWIEERDGKLFGFEFKWNNRKIKPPKTWLEAYNNTEFKVITKDNYLEFIT